MKPYPKYKPTNIEWIGEIPKHWEVKRLKFIASINPTSYNYDFDEQSDELVAFLPMECVSEDGKINETNFKELKSVARGFTYFEKGDVIIAKITPCFENGKGALLTSLPTNFGFGSTEFHVLRQKPNISSNRFLYYITRSQQFRMMGEKFMSGAAGQKRVPTNFISDLVFTKPSIEEQATIANFLDVKTKLIDEAIIKKQDLIDLLKEERIAVINNVVTKGINPKAKMKPSGVEWFGDVPKHWEIRKVSRSFEIIGSGTTPSAGNETYYENGTTNWLLTGDLNDGLLYETKKKVTEKALKDFSALKIFPKGSIAIAMYGATIGKVALLQIETTTNQACCILGNSPYYSQEFIFYWFIANKRNIVSLGTGGGQPNVSQDVIRTLKIPCPPSKEQTEIVTYVQTIIKKIDTTISTLEKEIELLEEYRITLISEVVTGKVDVRGEMN